MSTVPPSFLVSLKDKSQGSSLLVTIEKQTAGKEITEVGESETTQSFNGTMPSLH